MNILIELPTWLGDAIMASSAIENLSLAHPNAKFTFFGSKASCEIYKIHPKCHKIVFDLSKKVKNRFCYLRKKAKKMGEFDLAISFRSAFASKFFLKFLNAKKRISFYKIDKKHEIHQVKRYNDFLKTKLDIKIEFDELKLYFKAKNYERPTLGLNPGASYGSAKRWYPKYFAQVAAKLSDMFDIVIFGGKNEEEICKEIENELLNSNIECKNLCNKTNIKELCESIAGLRLFITNDSGPMHIAAAYKIPTIALFGPTKFSETSPYKNENAKILHLDLSCMPCMKRVCPLGTHECMKDLTPDIVFEEIKSFKLHRIS